MTDISQQTAALVTAAIDGDEASFTRLVENHKDAVFAIALSRTGDCDAAGDIAQEVFLRAYLGLDRLKDPALFSGWLRTIVENRCRTWVDRRRRQPAREVFDSTAPHLAGDDAPDRDLRRAERRRVVLDAIERLTPNTRETIVLHYLEGVPTPQLATLLSISEAAVRQRLHRGREQMRREVTHMIDETLQDESPGDTFAAELENLLARSRTRFGGVRYRDAVSDLERAAQLKPDDPTTALLIADAYAFARPPEELAEQPRDARRAIEVLDEAIAKADGKDRLVLRLKRASVKAAQAFAGGTGSRMLAVLKENRTLLKEAEKTTLEPVAVMELARRCVFAGQSAEAVELYERLGKEKGWGSLMLSEIGMAKASSGDVSGAIASFEHAVASTTQATMKALNDAYRAALGDAYWSFWGSVEILEVRQCQNHAWLAGLRTGMGEAERGHAHLRSAVELLDSEAMSPMRAVLAPEMVRRFDQMFPFLSDAPELQTLREEWLE